MCNTSSAVCAVDLAAAKPLDPLTHQVWVLINRDTRHVCVAWRGTEQSKWQDVLTDLSLMPAAFTSERVVETSAGGLGKLLGRVQVGVTGCGCVGMCVRVDCAWTTSTQAVAAEAVAGVMERGVSKDVAVQATAKLLAATQQALAAAESTDPLVGMWEMDAGFACV